MKNVKVEEQKSHGIGFCGLLAIVFITLKLTNYIDWSWGWVLAPLWMPFVIVMVILIVLAVLNVTLRGK